jgi:hypothetical protein
MRDLFSRIARLLVAIAFVSALGFGLGQTGFGICDTPPGSCTENWECDYPVCEYGGHCWSVEDCCICLDR